jgi:phosphatidate cytidylyltransferase
MTKPGVWADLGPRMASGAGMVALGALAIWAGGWWFAALAVAVAGLMVWELSVMIRPDRPQGARLLGLVAAVAVLIALFVPGALGIVPLAAVALGGAIYLRREPFVFATYCLAILLAAWGLVGFRADYGMVWLIWLVLVVVVTDIAGYFAGRAFGGPKFWPAVSPGKTWSGTVAGWVGAALVGAIFLRFTTAGPDLPWISAALSLASQMGDIAESAIKRRMGVKDSSHLIPGHGGLLDRFDGMLGASLFMLLVALIVVVPEVRL